MIKIRIFYNFPKIHKGTPFWTKNLIMMYLHAVKKMAIKLDVDHICILQ